MHVSESDSDESKCATIVVHQFMYYEVDGEGGTKNTKVKYL